MRSRLSLAALLGLSLFLAVCKTPPVPPEAAQAVTLEHELWRAGALILTPAQYDGFKQDLRQAKDHLIKVKSKFAWFRNYEDVQKEYQKVLARGRALAETIQTIKKNKTQALGAELAGLKERLAGLHRTTQSLNEGRLARSSLTRAEIAVSEAEILLKKGQFDGSAKKIAEAEDFFRDGQEILLSLLERYFDPKQVRTWKKMIDKTIADARARRTTVLIVSKLDRELVVYRGDTRLASFGIGLGRFGLSDKVYSGDDATPEGRYHITKKLNWSKFYKALLLNYPNDEDRDDFTRAKKKGLLPASASIGGLIEIHGGGTEGITNGCIAVDNEAMDKLFKLVEVGTPVTIVGTTMSMDEILKTLNMTVLNDK